MNTLQLATSKGFNRMTQSDFNAFAGASMGDYILYDDAYVAILTPTTIPQLCIMLMQDQPVMLSNDYAVYDGEVEVTCILITMKTITK